jgi:DNA-binding transcriptional ArsR family regulator
MHQTSQNLDRVFFALSDGTRRGILARLAQGSTTIGELAAPRRADRKKNQWPAASMHPDDRRIEDRRGLAELPSAVLGIAF